MARIIKGSYFTHRGDMESILDNGRFVGSMLDVIPDAEASIDVYLRLSALLLLPSSTSVNSASKGNIFSCLDVKKVMFL